MRLQLLFLFCLLVVVIQAQKGVKRPKPGGQNFLPSPSDKRKQQQQKPSAPREPAVPVPDEPESGGEAENNGESGPEPPAVVPQTSFTCEDKPFNPGMYADMEVDCSVYHMCYNGRKESFLCGTGTMFNQEILSCDHPAKVKCSDSPNHYEANNELGKPGAEPGGDSAPKPAPRPNRPAPRPNQPPRSPGSPGGKVFPSKPNQPEKIPDVSDDDEDDGNSDSTNYNEGSSGPDASSKTSPPRPIPRPAPKSPQIQRPSRPAPKPALKPAPKPAPKVRPGKTNQKPNKVSPRPGTKSQPLKPKKPIEQVYVEADPEQSDLSRAYRARF